MSKCTILKLFGGNQTLRFRKIRHFWLKLGVRALFMISRKIQICRYFQVYQYEDTIDTVVHKNFEQPIITSLSIALISMFA